MEETRSKFEGLVKELLKEVEGQLDKLNYYDKAAGGLDYREETEMKDRREHLEAIKAELKAGGVLFMGMDNGKKGQNAVMAPFVIRKAVEEKARAEAELAVAIESGDEDRIRKAEEMVKKATLSEDEARQLSNPT